MLIRSFIKIRSFFFVSWSLLQKFKENQVRWSLRNDDDDGNENGKKAIGLDKQNNVARPGGGGAPI